MPEKEKVENDISIVLKIVNSLKNEEWPYFICPHRDHKVTDPHSTNDFTQKYTYHSGSIHSPTGHFIRYTLLLHGT